VGVDDVGVAIILVIVVVIVAVARRTLRALCRARMCRGYGAAG
jgi:hypothetical protein